MKTEDDFRPAEVWIGPREGGPHRLTISEGAARVIADRVPGSGQLVLGVLLAAPDGGPNGKTFAIALEDRTARMLAADILAETLPPGREA